MRGKNSPFSAARNSLILDLSILQVMIREYIACLRIAEMAVCDGVKDQAFANAARTLDLCESAVKGFPKKGCATSVRFRCRAQNARHFARRAQISFDFAQDRLSTAKGGRLGMTGTKRKRPLVAAHG